MANQTVTNQTVNHDSASVLGLLNGEQYTLNNSTLVVDADVRWGQNAAVLGRVSISNTQGGKFLIDGTKVWELPFTVSGGSPGVGGDPTLSSNSLLINMGGANGNTTITDLSTPTNTFTAVGNATISDAFPLFGNNTALIGGPGAWFQTQNDLDDFRFGTGDFTIELWVRTFFAGSGGFALLDFHDPNGGAASVGAWQVFLGSGGNIDFWTGSAGGEELTLTYSAPPNAINDAQWHHVALSRASGTLRLFIDGVLVASVADGKNYNATSVGTFAIGAQVNVRNPSYDALCYIGPIRIKKGVSEYQANFTPPNDLFPTTSGGGGSGGTVPTLLPLGENTVIGQTSGAVGELIRIWDSANREPLGAGQPLPADGWMKLRSKTGDFLEDEIVLLPNGGSVEISSQGKRSWIHVVGTDSLDINVPRLGLFELEGDWYELGVTNGATNQIINFPVADVCPAIQIESSPGSNEYEWWLNAGSRWTQTTFVALDQRGKYFGQSASDWNITLAHRAATSSGLLPAAGCRIRVPNVFCSSSASANWNANTINATIANRYDFVTTSAGEIKITNASMNWYLSCSAAFSVEAYNSSFLHAVLVANVAEDTIFDNCAIGLWQQSAFTALTATNMFSGLSVRNCRFARYSLAASGNTTASITDASNIFFENTQLEAFGNTAAVTRGNAAVHTILLTRCFNSTFIDCSLLGARLTYVSCSDSLVRNLAYSDIIGGTTTSTNGTAAIEANTASTNILIDGVSIFADIANTHPYNNILNVSTGCKNISLTNVGSPAQPFNAGTVDLMGTILTATVTTGITLRRCYSTALRTSAIAVNNTVQDLILDNVWGGINNTQVIAAVNVTARGCQWRLTTTGQTSCYGRHWEDAFRSDDLGILSILANEPLGSTQSQVQTNLAPGSGFTSTGSISMATVGDNIIWELPYPLLGYTGFNSTFFNVIGTNIQNHDFDYQINTGAGFSEWRELFTTRVRSGGGTAGATTFTITNLTTSRNPQVGDYVFSTTGTHFAPNTQVTAISGTTITLSQPILVTLPTSLLVGFFPDLPSQTFSGAGFSLRVRATTTNADNGNLLTAVQLGITTNSVTKQTQYPLPGIPLEFTNLRPNSEVRVFLGNNPETAVEIGGVELSGTSFSMTHSSPGLEGYAIIHALGFLNQKINLTFSSIPTSIPINQTIDRVFDNPPN